MPTPLERVIFHRADAAKEHFHAVAADQALDAIDLGFSERNDGLGGMEQVGEVEVVRHYTRLSLLNWDIDRGLYPLGSCTMKHNPRLNERVAADPAYADAHPEWPATYLAQHKRIMSELAHDLATLSGFDKVCLQPAAGAHGELTAVFMIRAWHLSRGDTKRDVFLIPDSAHGTNPASAAMSGFRCVQVKSGPNGTLRIEDIQAHLNERLAAIMITNPNTLGIYETQFSDIADAVHKAGGLVYMDGANFNAAMGVFQPGRIGADVMHFNLHKTFTTPHGGGGPGSGPIGFNENLAPFAPDSGLPQSIGRVKAWFGQWGMYIRAWVYIRSLGSSGLSEATEQAVLNANYLRSRLDGVLNLPVKAATLHEVVFNDRDLPNKITTLDLAKRLIDFGFHPPTVYFPIHVPGALMIEPTETESLDELDRFCDALCAVVTEAAEDPERLKTAPHTTCVSRVDEVLAARSLDVRWTAAECG
ncbi:MAG: aminotransferase class V-fold PLP-dependent enzyme [Planctomycetes bacterium]|nr:aminotransferase class V-fold PLP-dependent enzyme [Planctomycetota bacterium]